MFNFGNIHRQHLFKIIITNNPNPKLCWHFIDEQNKVINDLELEFAYWCSYAKPRVKLRHHYGR